MKWKDSGKGVRCPFRVTACPPLISLLLISSVMGLMSCSRDVGKQSGASKYSNRIAQARRQYKTVKAPVGARSFSWDFTKKGKVLKYSYQQRAYVKSLIAVNGKRLENKTRTRSYKGTLVIESQGGGRGQMILRNGAGQNKSDNSAISRSDKENGLGSGLVFKDMKEDGRAEFGRGFTGQIMKVFMPLPGSPLKVGDTAVLKKEIPVTLDGAPSLVRGTVKVTLAGYVSIKHRTCAQFNVMTNISQVDAPAEVRKNCKVMLQGIGVFYFDIFGRHVVSGSLAIALRSTDKTPPPGIKMKEPNEKKDFHYFGSTLFDNYVQIKLHD